MSESHDHQLKQHAQSIADLKASIDLREFVARTEGYGKRDSKSVRYWNPPWSNATHQSKGRAFAVYADGFKDHSSGESGDIIDWIERTENLTRAQAIQQLCEYVAGGALPVGQKRPERVHISPNEPPSAAWQESAHKNAINPSEQRLWQTPSALTYLRNARGLTDETIRHFRLGYNSRWYPLPYKNSETGKQISLATGITIPYIAGGAIWALRIRRRVGELAAMLGIEADHDRDGEEAAKYINLAGAGGRRSLFNADALRPNADVLFVEGEFDAMLGHQELGAADCRRDLRRNFEYS